MQIVSEKALLNNWEPDWIKLLIGVENFSSIKFFDDFSLVDDLQATIIIANYFSTYKNLIEKLIHKQLYFGVILLSDERLIDSCEYIESDYCIFIARNCLHPKIHTNPKNISFGLGYRARFNSNDNLHIKSSDRVINWNFVGSLSHNKDRDTCINEFSKIKNSYSHFTTEFNSSDYLPIEKYQRVLEQSVFTLCPVGQINIDTFRLYEALEAGSIPVVLKFAPHLRAEPSYWHHLFRGEQHMPFVCVNNWVEAVDLCSKLLERPELLNQIQMDCKTFWRNWKINWQNYFSRQIALFRTFDYP